MSPAKKPPTGEEESHEDFLHLFRRGLKFTEELLAENEKLRYRIRRPALSSEETFLGAWVGWRGRVFRLGRGITLIRTGRGAHTLFWAPDRKTIWVNSRLDPVSVVVLDAATLEPLRRYKLPGGPDDLEFAPDGRVWFTMRFIHKVAVLDPGSGDFTTIDVGRSPHGIFLNPRAVAAV